MKFFFRSIFAIFLLSKGVEARDIVLITHQDNADKAQTIQSIIQKEFSIPSRLIVIRQRLRPCHADQNTLWHICVEPKTHSMKIVLIKQKTIAFAFQVFQKTKAQEKPGPVIGDEIYE